MKTSPLGYLDAAGLKIVELVAKDLHKQVSYVWWAQRRGYVRNTLNEA